MLQCQNVAILNCNWPLKCYTSANSVTKFNYLVKSSSYNKGIGTCVTYLTDSNTTKNAGIGPILIQISGIGAALNIVQLYISSK